MGYIAPVPSAFRHVYAQVGRAQDGYLDIMVSQAGVDSNFAACNSKFIAVCWDVRGGGAFGVLTTSGKGKIGTKVPLFEGHKGQVIDVAFSPFNDNLVVSASEDAMIKVWNVVVGDAGQVVGTKESMMTLSGHNRRVARVAFNPLVDGVLASLGGENTVKIWDVAQATAAVTLKSPSSPQYMDVCWSLDGNKVVVPAKDKHVHGFDVRSGQEIFAAASHQGVKGSRAVWYDPLNYICTTGFENSGARSVIVRDVRQPDQKLAEEEVDHNAGMLIPFLDPDHGFISMFGKGDAAIKFYELRGGAPVLLSCSSSQISEPVKAVGMAPKYAVNTEICEIDRFYSVMQSKALVPINVIVPRRGGDGMFQTDLYPDPVGPDPSVGFADWWAGTDAEPHRISLQDGRPASGPRDWSSQISATPSQGLVGAASAGVVGAPSGGGARVSLSRTATDSLAPPPPRSPSDASLSSKLTKAEEDNARLSQELKEAQAEIAKLRARIDELEAKAKGSGAAKAKGALVAGPPSGAERPEVGTGQTSSSSDEE